MFFPFFIYKDCNCADRVIEYLEEDKYTYVAKELTKKQRTEMQKMVESCFEEIDKTKFMSLVKKAVAKQIILRDTFFNKVEKSTVKD